MIIIAARGPAENARRIVGAGAQVIGLQPSNPILSAFGITIDLKMVLVPARVLRAPTLLYADKETLVPQNASWNTYGKKFFKAIDLRRWTIIKLGSATFRREHLEILQIQMGKCGMGSAAPSPSQGYTAALGIEGDDDSDMAIREVLFKAKKEGHHYAFVVIPKKSKSVYGRIKYYADRVVRNFLLYLDEQLTERLAGIHTTIMVSNKVSSQCKNKQGANYFAK